MKKRAILVLPILLAYGTVANAQAVIVPPPAPPPPGMPRNAGEHANMVVQWLKAIQQGYDHYEQIILIEKTYSGKRLPRDQVCATMRRQYQIQAKARNIENYLRSDRYLMYAAARKYEPSLIKKYDGWFDFEQRFQHHLIDLQENMRDYC